MKYINSVNLWDNSEFCIQQTTGYMFLWGVDTTFRKLTMCLNERKLE